MLFFKAMMLRLKLSLLWTRIICQLLMYILLLTQNNAVLCKMKRLRYYVEPTLFLWPALLNAGEEYANNKDYNNALAYYNRYLFFIKIKL
jgi:hypothetical protein